MKNQLRLWNVLVATALLFGLAFGGGAPRAVQAAPSSLALSLTTPVTQNFDGLSTSATATMPTDWKVDKQAVSQTVGTYTAAVAATERLGGNNMSTSASNGIYNYGAGDPAAATDRAIGFLSTGSGTKSGNVYAFFNNGTGVALTGVVLSYNVEKYRNGSNPAGFSIQLYYSLDGSAWTSAGPNFLTSFSANVDNNGFASAPGATTAITNQTLLAPIPAGSNVYLAWNYSVTAPSTTTTNSQGLGIDDVSVLGTNIIPPSASGSASPNKVLLGGSSLLTVAVTPGSNPASTGLEVACDLSTIGGSASQDLTNDGSNNFTYTATVDAATAAGAKSLPCSISDDQLRTATTSIALTVFPSVVTIGAVNGPIADTDVATTHNAALKGQTATIQGVIYEISWQPNKSAPYAYYGFFVQNTAAAADGDPNTSDGIYVYNGTSTTVANAAGGTYTPTVGDEVVIAGSVTEYFNMTELSSPTYFQTVRSGVDIDTEIAPFVAAPPADLADANRYWERRQGMRAQVPQNSVVISGRNVFSPPDGEVWVAAPDSTIAQRSDPYQRRAFRDAHPLDDNYSATTWDGNGYRILMGSWGIKATLGDTAALIVPARTFDVVTNAPVGGVNYSFSKYRIEVTTQPTLNDGVDPADNNPPAKFDSKSGYSIVDYNLENLYDFRDNPFSGCDWASDTGCPKSGPFLSAINPPYDYVPASDAVYQARLTDIATQIIDDLHSPDILMLQEVENQDFCSIDAGSVVCGATDNADGRPDVLQDLALKITALGGPTYDSAFDRDSSDLRGILPAYMFRTNRVQLLPASASDPVLGSSPTTNFTYPFGAPVANNSQVSNPKSLNAVLPAGITACETNWVFPRAASVALFRIFQNTIGDETYADVYTLNNHFKSGPDSCVTHRTEQAKYNAAIVTSIEAAQPTANVVVAGDFNVYPRPDDPFAPMGQAGNSDQLGSLYSPGLGLTNLWDVILAEAPASAYSYGYIGMAQTLDQMFANQPLMSKLAQFRIAHINSDFPADNPGDGPRGTSDHDPNVAIFGFGPAAASATAANVVAKTTAFNQVDVTWQSTREATISGFNVYRSLVGDDGNKLKLNDTLIAVKFPDSPLGSAYAFTYMTTLVGVDYNYWIEVVYSNATTAMVGPVLDPATYLSFVPFIKVAAP